MLFYPSGGFPMASASGGDAASNTGTPPDPSAFLKQMMLMRALQGGATGAAQAMGGAPTPNPAQFQAQMPGGLPPVQQPQQGGGIYGAANSVLQPVLARLMQMSRPPLPQQPGQPQFGGGGMPITQP